MSAVLILLGTLLLKATENVTWLGAFFQSVSARTAGFSTYPIGSFTDAGLFVLILLMFVGASPGSTGGGIKTTTLFALLQATRSAATGRMPTAFRRTVAGEVVQKAFIVTLLSAFVVCGGTFILCLLEPDLTFLQLLFEATSAFGTVGLSTGITPQLQPASKLIVILIMYTGRIGPLTVASLWAFRTGAARLVFRRNHHHWIRRKAWQKIRIPRPTASSGWDASARRWPKAWLPLAKT